MCAVDGRPSDGRLLMSSDRPSLGVILSFSQPISAFGAYWGTGVGCPQFGFDDSPIVLTFYDVNDAIIASDAFAYNGDGRLLWRGYRFSTPVKKSCVKRRMDAKASPSTDCKRSWPHRTRLSFRILPRAALSAAVTMS